MVPHERKGKERGWERANIRPTVFMTITAHALMEGGGGGGVIAGRICVKVSQCVMILITVGLEGCAPGWRDCMEGRRVAVM